MKFRFRHLEQRAAIHLSDRSWKENQRHLPSATEQAGGISSVEGEASLESLQIMLREGLLYTEDLVDFGRGWETIAETPELAEFAASLNSWRRRVLPGLFVATVLACTIAIALGRDPLKVLVLAALFGTLVVPIALARSSRRH